MKNLFLQLTILCFFCSCNTNKGIKNEISSQHFKDRTLEKCLLEGYGNKNLVKKINEIDRSIYNPIAIAFYDEAIDDYLKPKILEMKKDSLESITKVSESRAGKIVFDKCLLIYKSKELNEFTKRSINDLKRKKNLDSFFYEKNPAF